LLVLSPATLYSTAPAATAMTLVPTMAAVDKPAASVPATVAVVTSEAASVAGAS